MKVVYLHVSDYATISQEGKLSVCGIFSRLTVLSAPNTFPVFYIVVGFKSERDDIGTESSASVKLISPDGLLLKEASGSLEVAGDAELGEFGLVIPIADHPPIQSLGPHVVEVFINGKSVLDVTLEVVSPGQASHGKQG